MTLKLPAYTAMLIAYVVVMLLRYARSWTLLANQFGTYI